jgi:hypothetical protein
MSGYPQASRFGVTALGLVLLGACVSDPDIEDSIPPPVGLIQPESTEAATVSVDEACASLVAVEAEVRGRLGCAPSAPPPTCPEYLWVAGALPCERVRADTVAACTAHVQAFSDCSAFDTRRCVVTVDVDSCVAPRLPGTGGTDAGSPDGAVYDAAAGDGAASDAGALIDGSLEPPDGSATDDASLDSGSDPSDGSPADAAPDA